jgi:hypothetical protein
LACGRINLGVLELLFEHRDAGRIAATLDGKIAVDTFDVAADSLVP